MKKNTACYCRKIFFLYEIGNCSSFLTNFPNVLWKSWTEKSTQFVLQFFYKWEKILKLGTLLLIIHTACMCIEWLPEIIKGSILSFYPTAGMMYLYIELLSIKISMSDSKFLSVSDWDQEYYNLRLILLFDSQLFLNFENYTFLSCFVGFFLKKNIQEN